MKHLQSSRGFTLVEMLVIAPVVILAIGAFIAAIVGITGEVLSSRGSNAVAYDIQSALTQIEEDTRLSVSFLAVNDKDVAVTSSGIDNSTTPFKNNSETLILSSIITTNNPSAPNASALFLNNAPESCSNLSPSEYFKNSPMTSNIVYYTKAEANGTKSLWRRVVMQSTYANSNTYCGSTGAWQQPSCSNYGSGSLPAPVANFCKTSDSRILSNLDSSNGPLFTYFPSPGSTTPSSNTESPSDTSRQAALSASSTLAVNLGVKRSIAGRDVARNGTIRITRLDTNASAIAKPVSPTSVPATPDVSMSVSEGRKVTATWKKQDSVTSYTLRYRNKDAVTGVWSGWTTVPSATLNNRTMTIQNANHGDEVSVELHASNSLGQSVTPATKNLVIPVWAPLTLDKGWRDYNRGYGPASYTRTKAGLVMLRGMIERSNAATVGEVIAKLPDDYAPAGGYLLFGNTSGSNNASSLQVGAAGEIITSTGARNDWTSLETIRYVAANAGYTRTAATLQNGFTNTGAGSAPASYVQDSSGRVNVQGLLANGNRANSVSILTIPSNLMPQKYQHHASRSNSFHHIGIHPGVSGIVAKGDGLTGNYSINLSYLPASHTGWTNLTLTNGWVYYDNDSGMYSTPQYTKTNDNVVTLKGLIRSGTGPYDSTIATLPVGFRPKSRIILTTTNTAVHSRVDILTNGEIHFMGASNGWYALDGLMFVAEQ